MPATSKQQQKLFGLALSVKDGDTPRSEVSKSVLDIVDKMSRKEIEKFAGTKHKGLPDKKEIYSMKESIRSIIRNEILNMKNKFMFEANFQKGDNVRIKKNAKNVTDPKNLGKAGVILNKDGRHYMVKLPNAQLLVSPSDLELMPESHTPSHPNAAKLDRIADKLSNLELKGKENTPEYKKLDKMYKELEKKVKESVNEASLELKKLEDAIKMFQDKIKKQGRITNARDEEHLQNLIKVYKQMGGKNIKESVNEGIKSTIQKLFKSAKKKMGVKKIVEPSDDIFLWSRDWVEKEFGKGHTISGIGVDAIQDIIYLDVMDVETGAEEELELDIPKNLKESVNDLKEVKVHFEKKLKNGNIFQVVDRDTKGMRGTQDKFLMQIVDTSGKVVKRIGSHPSLDGAKKFSNSVNEAPKLKITNTISKKAWEKTHKDYKSVIDGIPYVLKMTDNGTALVPVKIVESVNSRGIDSPIKLSSLISEASKVFWDDKKDAKWWHHAPSTSVVGVFNPKTWSTVDGYLYQTNDANDIKLKPGEEIFRYQSRNTLFGSKPLIKVDKRRGLVYFLKPNSELDDKIEFESKGIPVKYMRFIKGLVKEYRRYDPYRDDPRWIKAKFAGTDKNGNSFKRGEKVLYYPKTKAILSGKDADKAWREFQSMASDEFMMGAGYKPKGNSLSEDIVESMIRVTERVSVDDSPYKRVHGKSPRGFGTWAFSFNNKGDNQFFTPGPMNLNQAIKWAKDKAVSAGAYSVYVLG